ncbi:MAG: CCA tRNA nucleotidyltransferase [Candidatus Nanopelagicales bacterium]
MPRSLCPVKSNSGQLPHLAIDLGTRFQEAGFEISLVGGWVRDAVMGRIQNDLDFTTSANPEQILSIVTGWADAIWEVGIEFGTVGLLKNGHNIEITTYRAEAYDENSRKPTVQFGTSLEDDLSRRDFTINAMAITLPKGELFDPFGGINHIASQTITTPGKPEQSFSDDPLRMLRAARFASQLNFNIEESVLKAMHDMASRLAIISSERIRDELEKLLLSNNPRKGLEVLILTSIADIVLPEIPALKLEIDEHHRHKDVYEHSLIVLEQAIDLEQSHTPRLEPDIVLRLAALLHDIGKPKTRKLESGGGVSFHHHELVGARMAKKRLQELRFSNDVVKAVTRLIELHLRFHGYGTGQWTDSAVRRYVRDAGDELVRLHKLTRADCTTRNKQKAATLSQNYDALEVRIEELRAEEELNAIRPDLNGAEIMEILGIKAGPTVGKAYSYLLELRLDRGPMSKDEAKSELLSWWKTQQ